MRRAGRVGAAADDLYPVDLLGLTGGLTGAEVAALGRLRAVVEKDVRPVLAERWDREQDLSDLLPPLVALRLLDAPDLVGEGGEVRPLYRGFVALELARADLGLATAYGGQAFMFRTLVRAAGSEEQVAAWDGGILDFTTTGCFALTEPDHGSDVARGLATTARRSGGGWVLDGAKRWIGNATTSQHAVVVAREPDSSRVLAFVVPLDAEGVAVRLLRGKGAARTVHNAEVLLTGVEVGEELRLPGVESFADVGRALGSLRGDVVWTAAGMQVGAYEAALARGLARQQFGRPVAGFQLVQDKLVRIAGNTAQTLALAVHAAQHPPRDDAAASLAKLVAADRLRESVALAREVAGGDGLLLENDVVRFLADAEAVHTFEGTRDINTLVVGRALTGLSAFTR